MMLQEGSNKCVFCIVIIDSCALCCVCVCVCAKRIMKVRGCKTQERLDTPLDVYIYRKCVVAGFYAWGVLTGSYSLINIEFTLSCLDAWKRINRYPN